MPALACCIKSGNNYAEHWRRRRWNRDLRITEKARFAALFWAGFLSGQASAQIVNNSFGLSTVDDALSHIYLFGPAIAGYVGRVASLRYEIEPAEYLIHRQ